MRKSGYIKSKLVVTEGCFHVRFSTIFLTTVGDSQNEISGKKVKGIGLGNIFSAGPITLRPVPRNVTPSPRPAENKVSELD